MQLLTKSAIVAVVLCALAAPVQAQGFDPRPARPDHGIYLAALAGASFGPDRAPVFAAEFGERLHPDVRAYATISYFENLMDRSVQRELDQVSEDLGNLTGIPWALRGRDRGAAFVAGAKYLVPSRTVRPYIGGGAGFINLKRTITDRDVNPVDPTVFSPFDIDHIDLSTSAVTRPMAEATAGVAFFAGRTYVDIGYRFRRAFQMRDALEFSQVGVMLGVNF
jgi:hypothetical protein